VHLSGFLLCIQILQLDQLNRKQAIDLHVQARGRAELERTLTELRRDHGQATSANREAEEQLAASRSRLEELQRELSETRQELASTSAEHDRLARDLADAVALLQSKETEHTKLVQQLTS
jgi:septal ring factor EnvC (AmiA/AmiB activator)